jgi:Tol biopolymer transport system component
VSNRDFDREIYITNADGADVKRLTNDPDSPDLSPAWSPDGLRIAFVKAHDGRRDIYVVNTDGSGLVRLTNDDGQAASAAGTGKE